MLNVGEHNYLDGITWINGYSINASGEVSSNNEFMISGLIEVPTGDYVFTATNLNLFRRTVRIHGYNAEGTWVSQLAYQAAEQNASWYTTFTVPNNIAKVQILNFLLLII